MRKGPTDSATRFGVGETKKGNDGNIWIIVKNKNGVKRWRKQSIIFVLYSFDNIESWKYNLPKDWKWVGAGSAIGYPYEKEEQFSGPPESKKKIHEYLNKFFLNLTNKKIVKKYKIISSSSPSRNLSKTRKRDRKNRKPRKRKRRFMTRKVITLKKLREFKKKYSVTTTGNKLDIADGLWRVRGEAMADKDLEKIIPLLSKDYKKEAEKMLMERDDNPITDWKGMWVKKPKPVSKMTKTELVNNLRKFRIAWERETTRNQDLSDDRLNNYESVKGLRSLLEHYYSSESKQIAHNWLMK